MNGKKPTLSPLEQNTLELLVDSVRAIGLPRSLGEIYGILYLSPKPLCMDDIIQKLDISIGSASQGLRQLKSFKAIRTVYIQGQRKDYFIAENKLRDLSARFIKEEVMPRLEANCEKIAEIQKMITESPEAEREYHAQQINHLLRWQKNGLRVLKIIDKLI